MDVCASVISSIPLSHSLFIPFIAVYISCVSAILV